MSNQCVEKLVEAIQEHLRGNEEAALLQTSIQGQNTPGVQRDALELLNQTA